MWEQILSLAFSNGLWAVLFCLLFLYEIKDSRKREVKYQGTISSLCDRLETVNDIKTECGEIKTKVTEAAAAAGKRT